MEKELIKLHIENMEIEPEIKTVLIEYVNTEVLIPIESK